MQPLSPSQPQITPGIPIDGINLTSALHQDSAVANSGTPPLMTSHVSPRAEPAIGALKKEWEDHFEIFRKNVNIIAQVATDITELVEELRTILIENGVDPDNLSDTDILDDTAESAKKCTGNGIDLIENIKKLEINLKSLESNPDIKNCPKAIKKVKFFLNDLKSKLQPFEYIDSVSKNPLKITELKKSKNSDEDFLPDDKNIAVKDILAHAKIISGLEKNKFEEGEKAELYREFEIIKNNIIEKNKDETIVEKYEKINLENEEKFGSSFKKIVNKYFYTDNNINLNKLPQKFVQFLIKEDENFYSNYKDTENLKLNNSEYDAVKNKNKNNKKLTINSNEKIISNIKSKREEMLCLLIGYILTYAVTEEFVKKFSDDEKYLVKKASEEYMRKHGVEIFSEISKKLIELPEDEREKYLKSTLS